MNKSRLLFQCILAIAFSACLAGPLSAQDTAPSVHMLVTAEARKGTDVPDISRADVMVFEGRDRDQIVDWVPQGANSPVELYILLDDASNFSLGRQLDELAKFINAQPPSVKIGVAYMQNGMAKMQQGLTTDHELAAKALRLPTGIPGINGSPYFSLSDLIKHWPSSNARREVLMASDGIDEYYGPGNPDDPYLSATIDDCQRAGVLVYAIYTPGAGHEGHSYWQSYWGQIYLSRLASDTGGESYYIGYTGSPVTFTPYLEDMQRHLNHQYLLTFIPKPKKKSGWQRVRVATEVSNAELVSANKVWVQAEPQ